MLYGSVLTMSYKFVDVHGFAGGLSLGISQSGFTLVGKKELQGAFGAQNMEVNRHILGNAWQTQAGNYEDWEPIDAELIIGNPPCSGFSLLSSKSFRGVDSRANACMWGITEFAAKTAPPIFAFESVQGAYTTGADLMRDLRARLEELTGLKYDLTHVLHSARSTGNPQLRRRYMFVAHRIPFGMEPPTPRQLPTVQQAIGDLEGLKIQWAPQPYVYEPQSDYAARKRGDNVEVDGHIYVDSLGAQRIRYLLKTGLWENGKDFSSVIRSCYEAGIELPEIYAKKIDALIESDFDFGWNTPSRLKPDHTCPVVTGAGGEQFGHYKENRTITHREVARLMGYPDNWLIAPNEKYTTLKSAWGKGVTVDVGHYFGEWLYNSIDGNPGTLTGDLIGDRERLVNVTQSWKSFAA